jgi:hypothetical protein
MIRRTVGAGLAGLGLIGGAGAVAYNEDGSATVTVKDKAGVAQTVRLESGGKTFSCPDGTEEKVSPHDIRLGRIDLTIRRVRRPRAEAGNAVPRPQRARACGGPIQRSSAPGQAVGVGLQQHCRQAQRDHRHRLRLT